MEFFGDGNGAVHLSDFGEALFFGDFGKRRIHIAVFVFFALSRRVQIFHRRFNHTRGKSRRNFNVAAFQKFEHPFGVFLFLIGRFRENRGNLFKTFLFRDGGKIGVTHPRLRFSGE